MITKNGKHLNCSRSVTNEFSAKIGRYFRTIIRG